ncbi:MAG: caspase family protein [Kiritimatiellae bacterium]|nr:caspase family protein [Kiritimatiellia bacterium]
MKLLRHILTVSLAGMLGGCSLFGSGEAQPDTAVSTNAPVQTAPRTMRAVCVGLNSVDPAAWGGWDGKLTDCEFDATFAAAMWRTYGIATTQLLTRAATIANCVGALRWGVEGLGAGDMLIVWNSGHGGRVQDADFDEADRQDEYLCLYDGALTDDVIHKALQHVKPGVRILWICDTCHSGTMFRRRPVRFRPRAVRGFAGELILLAGCAEDKYSLSTGQGGMWSTALHDTGPDGQSPASWFRAAKERVPESQQVPVYVEYGAVSEGFRDGVIVE